MMNKYWQVALTYLRRPRFLLLVFCYLAVVGWRAASTDPAFQVVVSANLACVVGCFVALQLRRQFGSSSAHLLPGFMLPHLVVGGLVSGAVWIFLPLGLTLLGSWPPGALPVHAVAGLLLAAVACWPKAISLIAALPVVFAWSLFSATRENDGLVRHLLQGKERMLAIGLVLAAVLAHALAVWFLLRLSDQSASELDDLVVESPSSVQTSGRWYQWNLGFRDAVVERSLSRADRWSWPVGRWRIPTAISPLQLALPVLFVLAMMVVGLAVHEPGLGYLPALLTSCVILLAPYGPWQLRRGSLSWEFVHPVTRPQYCRQLAAALALDACLWTCLASAISIGLVVLLFFTSEPGEVPPPKFLAGHLAILWGMAALLYGIALATFRFRYWVLLIAALGATWTLAVWIALADIAIRTSGVPEMFVFVCVFSLASAVVGIALAWFAYRRWLEADLA
jgi:hypothetical protein